MKLNVEEPLCKIDVWFDSGLQGLFYEISFVCADGRVFMIRDGMIECLMLDADGCFYHVKISCSAFRISAISLK